MGRIGGIKISKKRGAIIYLIVFAIFGFLMVNFKLQSMDEIWCFGFSNRFSDGYIPYRDFNMIFTPVFVVFGSLFADSLFMFRIYGALICAGIISLNYCIYKKDNLNGFSVIVLMLVNGIILVIAPFANYNLLMILGLLISYILANRYFRCLDASSAFKFGLSLAVLFLIKQNVPTILILIFFVVFLFQWISKKITAKTLSFFLIGVALPIVTFCTALIISKSFIAFLDYCLFGLGSFTSLENLQLGSLPMILLSFVITCLIAIRFKNSAENKYQNFTALIFSISSFLLIIPLMDLYHSLLLLMFQITLSSSLLINLPAQNKGKMFRVLMVTVLICAFAFVAFSSFTPGKNGYVRSNIDPYHGIYLPEDFEANLSIVAEYIKRNEIMGLDVAIIDGSAYMYNLVAEDYNGILDLLNTGNIGTKTNEDIITLINRKDIILISKHYQWQDMKVFKDYVEAHYIAGGTVGDKIIYLKP